MGCREFQCRTWSDAWSPQQRLNLKRAVNLETARWFAATGGIRRCFAELDNCSYGGPERPVELLLRPANGRSIANWGKGIVAGDQKLFSPN
jgi:hypothetical protein